MSRTPVFPYLRPRAERIQGQPWEIRQPNGEFDVIEGNEVPAWDYNTRLAVRRGARLDLGGIASDCGLKPSARVRLSLTWRSTRTGLQGAGEGQTFDLGGGDVEAQVSLDLPGKDLGGTLILGLCLTLVSSGASPEQLAPLQPGSRLYEDELRLELEGSASRFPIEVIDFDSNYLLPSGGVWFLDWSPDALSVPVLGSLRLLINSQRRKVVAALSGDQSDSTNAAIRSAIHTGVAERLILGSLMNAEFVEEPTQYEEGSVGHAIYGLIQSTFGDPVDVLARRAETEPDYFHCEIQERLGLFAEEGGK